MGLALVDRRRARAGWTDATLATTWAAAGYRALGRTAAPDHAGRRERLARRVLARVPGGTALRRAVGS